MDKLFRQLISIAFAAMGVLALITGLVLEESLFWGLGLLLPSLAVLLWFDEMALNQKVWVSAVLGVAGLGMIIFGFEDFSSAFPFRFIGGGTLLLAGLIFLMMGSGYCSMCLRALSEKKREKSE